MWLFCLLDPGQIEIALTTVNIYTHPNQIPGYAAEYTPRRRYAPGLTLSLVSEALILLPLF